MKKDLILVLAATAFAAFLIGCGGPAAESDTNTAPPNAATPPATDTTAGTPTPGASAGASGTGTTAPSTTGE